MTIDSRCRAKEIRDEILSKPKLLTDSELAIIELIGDPKYTPAYVEEWINKKTRPDTPLEERLEAAGALGFYSAACAMINSALQRRADRRARNIFCRIFRRR